MRASPRMSPALSGLLNDVVYKEEVVEMSPEEASLLQEEINNISEQIESDTTDLSIVSKSLNRVLELTEEILEEKNMTVDHEEFKKEMEAQRERARSARGETSYMGADENPINKVKADVETEFVGYTSTTANGIVVVIATDEDFVAFSVTPPLANVPSLSYPQHRHDYKYRNGQNNLSSSFHLP